MGATGAEVLACQHPGRGRSGVRGSGTALHKGWGAGASTVESVSREGNPGFSLHSVFHPQ